MFLAADNMPQPYTLHGGKQRTAECKQLKTKLYVTNDRQNTAIKAGILESKWGNNRTPAMLAPLENQYWWADIVW